MVVCAYIPEYSFIKLVSAVAARLHSSFEDKLRKSENSQAMMEDQTACHRHLDLKEREPILENKSHFEIHRPEDVGLYSGLAQLLIGLRGASMFFLASQSSCVSTGLYSLWPLTVQSTSASTATIPIIGPDQGTELGLSAGRTGGTHNKQMTKKLQTTATTSVTASSMSDHPVLRLWRHAKRMGMK
jgi:hypothetical protein